MNPQPLPDAQGASVPEANLQALVGLLDGSADSSDVICRQALMAAMTMTGSPQGLVICFQNRQIQAVYQAKGPDGCRRLTGCEGQPYPDDSQDAILAAVDQQRPLIFNRFDHECPYSIGLPVGAGGWDRCLLAPAPGQEGTTVVVIVSNRANDYGEEAAIFVTAIARALLLRLRLVDLHVAQSRVSLVLRNAGVIAHDLRNVLATIGGTLELMDRNGPNQGANHNYRELAVHSVQSAAVIVDSIRNLGGRPGTAFSTVDVGVFLQQRQPLYQHLLGSDLPLTIHLDERESCVLADASRLEQVFINLLNNSRDALAAGGGVTIRLAAGCTATDANGAPVPMVEVTVTDSGPGMSESSRRKCLHPYQTTKADRGGTGLGLFIVQEAMEVHGGSVQIASTPGVGTVVTLRFRRI